MNRIHICLRVLAGLVFLLTGIAKLLNLNTFAIAVGDFGIVPDPTVTAVSLMVCLLEIAGGIGLLVGSRLANLMLIAMTIGFLLTIGYGLWLGLDIDCGCFGPSIHIPLSVQWMFDVILLIILGVIEWTRPGKTNVLKEKSK